MDKKHLRRVAQSEERVNEILTLCKEKQYDKIFELYGQQIYNIVVPKKYKEIDIKKLIEQGKFEQISSKYGAKTYKKYSDYIKAQKKYLETGSKTSVRVNRIKNFLIRHFLPTAFSTTLLLPAAVAPVFIVNEQKQKEKNIIEYQQEIEEYNDRIAKYAEEINSMELNDMQIIMKVMSDMWESIDGYGNPEMDLAGLYRLDLYDGGAGVCRNMADDVTAKLNAINPEYNARNMACYIDENAGINEFADIERSFADVGNIQTGDDNEHSESSGNNTGAKLLGNHMVTIVDIPVQNVTLVIDPTNPGLGVFKDGEIHMSFSETGQGIEISPIGQFVIEAKGVMEVGEAIVKSLLPSDYSLDELQEIYGVEAQNKALMELEKIYDMQGGNKALDILKEAESSTILEEIEIKNAHQEFVDMLHVEVDQIENRVEHQGAERDNDLEK